MIFPPIGVKDHNQRSSGEALVVGEKIQEREPRTVDVLLREGAELGKGKNNIVAVDQEEVLPRRGGFERAIRALFCRLARLPSLPFRALLVALPVLIKGAVQDCIDFFQRERSALFFGADRSVFGKRFLCGAHVAPVGEMHVAGGLRIGDRLTASVAAEDRVRRKGEIRRGIVAPRGNDALRIPAGKKARKGEGERALAFRKAAQFRGIVLHGEDGSLSVDFGLSLGLCRAECKGSAHAVQIV